MTNRNSGDDMQDWGDLIGRRVEMMAADHPHADESGVVVRVQRCSLCSGDCGYPELVVRLDDGTETRVYEPEVDFVCAPAITL